MFALTNAEIETITKGRISKGTVVVKESKPEKVFIRGQLVDVKATRRALFDIG